MVTCFHGFLGSPSDFDFLNGHIVEALDLDKLIDQSIEQIAKVVTGDILVGYSFGARLALRVFALDPNRFEKIILLAGHMGLPETEKKDREKVEEYFLKMIDENSMSDFIDKWNQLELFEFDQKIVPVKQDKEVLRKYFINWGLSKQEDYHRSLLPYKDKLKWYFGANDKKYCEYAKKNLGEYNVEFIPNAGHRLLQNETVKELIKRDIL